jgi:hypothetical protein
MNNVYELKLMASKMKISLGKLWWLNGRHFLAHEENICKKWKSREI